MSHAWDEIHGQPETWSRTLATVPDQWQRIARHVEFPRDGQVLFVGCGTSYYLAQTAAHVFQETTGLLTRAIPGSEVFLSGSSTLPQGRPCVAFVFSRSGATSEAVLAARYLAEHHPTATTIGITCTPGSALVHAAHHAIELPHVDERSVVMTSTFTNMLVALQVVGAMVGGDDAFRTELETLPDHLRRQMPEADAFGAEIGSDLALCRVFYLGLGPNYGLAEEATLKLKEMTQVDCEPYGPLEFRHGAISTVVPGTAVVFIEGERERAYVGEVEELVKQYGARVATVSPYASDHADRTLLLPAGLSDRARCVLYLPALQLLAHERATALGLDPDAPRNLGKVTVISAR